MTFLIAFLAACVLLSIHPVIGYYYYKSRFEKLEKDFNQLQSDKKELISKNNELKHKADHVDTLREWCAGLTCQADSLRQVLGATKEYLTPEQRSLIKYPILNPSRVYHTRSGNAFHSISSCCTNSGSCKQISIKAAKAYGYYPCSKCVDPKQLERYDESI